MTRRDRGVVGGPRRCVLAVDRAGRSPSPALHPAAPRRHARRQPRPSTPVAAVSRGRRRPARLGQPADRPDAADRDLVALVFSGLVALGPDDTLVADLAERWTVDETGASWTFQLRPDARWHDGEPVTAADVVFTIDVLQDPTYIGPAARRPGARSRDRGRRADGPVRRSTTPLGGFLQAATQPIVPAHLLDGVPVAELADASVRPAPGRLRAVPAASSSTTTTPILEPAVEPS